jgi:2,3-bisphosphoglycerate-dependent phosphoglycerate mutase
MRDFAESSLREMEFLILRHCEKSGDGLCDPLTDRGRADAQRLAERLKGEGVDAIHASPYRRSQESIAPFAEAAGIEVITDARLQEWQISPTALAAMQELAPKMTQDRHFRAPWSETLHEVWARLEPALLDIRASGAKKPLLACHFGVLIIALAHLADGFGPRDWRAIGQPTAAHVHRGRWRKLELGA